MARSVTLFLAWVIVGFIGSFLLLYGFTPAGPAILLIVWLGCRFLPRIDRRRSPEAFGALAGFGAFSVTVASTVDDEGTRFATVGAVAVVAAILSYLVVGRSRYMGRPAPS